MLIPQHLCHRGRCAALGGAWCPMASPIESPASPAVEGGATALGVDDAPDGSGASEPPVPTPSGSAADGGASHLICSDGVIQRPFT